MDEIKKFFNIVKKYLLVLIVVPVITIIITYFLVKNLPDSYVSQAQIATGIVDETRQYQQQYLASQSILQGDQITQEFSNLITMMKMKKLLDQISYKLILNDLSSGRPLREKSKLFKTLNEDARKHAADVFQQKYDNQQGLDLSNPDQNGLYKVLASMRYDSESLSEKLNIFRSGDSDFIIIQFESEDPLLSAYVVNTLSAEFIVYYSAIVKTNQIKATKFLGELLKEKSDTLAQKMSVLRSYKIKNRVLNLDEQSKQLYSTIAEYENSKQEAVQSTASYAGALNEIDRKFSPKERQYIESTMSKVNQDIVETKQQLAELYDLYYKSEFEENYKSSIDSLQKILTLEINKSSDQYIVSPLATKQALMEQKIDLEVKMDLSRYSINALEREIDRLNAQFDRLVPREAEVQTYEMSIDIATKEYMDILNKYNQSSLESGISVKLNVAQDGLPGLAQPSKKMLLVILSGIVAGVFILVALFVLFLLDRSIISPEELANKTGMSVLGTISELTLPSVDLRDIWRHDDHSPIILELKNQLRSIRYEIENNLTGKVLIVNSLTPLQGKTFIATSLAFAWLMTNKKILVIDGNFNSPKLSSTATSSSIFVEDFFQSKSAIDYTSLQTNGLVILKNRGGNSSLIEIASYEQIRSQFDNAKNFFDLIIIETAPLSIVNQSKEWLSFADNIVSIFNYGQSINPKKQKLITYLQKSDGFLGWIMNKVPTKS